MCSGFLMFERELNDLLNGLMPPAKAPFRRKAERGQFAGCDLPGELRFEQLAVDLPTPLAPVTRKNILPR